MRLFYRAAKVIYQIDSRIIAVVGLSVLELRLVELQEEESNKCPLPTDLPLSTLNRRLNELLKRKQQIDKPEGQTHRNESARTSDPILRSVLQSRHRPLSKSRNIRRRTGKADSAAASLAIQPCPLLIEQANDITFYFRKLLRVLLNLCKAQNCSNSFRV